MLESVNWVNAIIITVVGISIVFMVLMFLIGIIQVFGYIMAPKVVRRTNTYAHHTEQVDEKTVMPALDSVAIAMALHLYLEDIHDEENHSLTLKNIERRYSPWNSKIYGLNNNFSRN